MTTEYRGWNTCFNLSQNLQKWLPVLLLLLIAEVFLFVSPRQGGSRNSVLVFAAVAVTLFGGILIIWRIIRNKPGNRVLLSEEGLDFDGAVVPYADINDVLFHLIIGRSILNTRYGEKYTTHVFQCCIIHSDGHKTVQIGERLGRFDGKEPRDAERIKKEYPLSLQDEGDRLPYMLVLNKADFKGFLEDLKERTGLDLTVFKGRTGE